VARGLDAIVSGAPSDVCPQRRNVQQVFRGMDYPAVYDRQRCGQSDGM